MTTITTKLLDELLDYLDKSIESISKDVIKNSEFHTDMEKLEEFLSSQYDIRLENLLKSKNSSIHHLESGNVAVMMACFSISGRSNMDILEADVIVSY